MGENAITLLFMIYFRKAFDLVNSDLLKFFYYGFVNNSLGLIADYFSNRSQKVNYNKAESIYEFIKLGVLQGSILDPLFFLIFINDLPFLLELCCKLFADDTTLYLNGNNIDTLIVKFNKLIDPLIEWCLSNKLDFNWSKTFFMIKTISELLDQLKYQSVTHM